ncbi:hypothetical protein BCR44DRAFT_163286 [Catenaria anguillulae PL171]|uniref:Uncharacterized protein n=1 Tax=Catenaria anguillulae PL171 TaxID=765915 RepID=A0A1Y2H5L1_9FUNG|nr:hypothetical protein BCR44DRAFT_163286 [Catenaria anguillulae PL171]
MCERARDRQFTHSQIHDVELAISPLLRNHLRLPIPSFHIHAIDSFLARIRRQRQCLDGRQSPLFLQHGPLVAPTNLHVSLIRCVLTSPSAPQYPLFHKVHGIPRQPVPLPRLDNRQHAHACNLRVTACKPRLHLCAIAAEMLVQVKLEVVEICSNGRHWPPLAPGRLERWETCACIDPIHELVLPNRIDQSFAAAPCHNFGLTFVGVELGVPEGLRDPQRKHVSRAGVLRGKCFAHIVCVPGQQACCVDKVVELARQGSLLERVMVASMPMSFSRDVRDSWESRQTKDGQSQHCLCAR